VVAGRQEREAEVEDRLLRAGVDEDLLGAESRGPCPRVELGDVRPEARVAARLRVAEPEGEESLLGSRLQGQELADGHALAVRGAKEEPRGELVGGEEAL